MENFNKKVAEDLNKKIIRITLIIKAKFPELSKFLDEMPDTMPNNKQSKVSYHDLNEYYKSLEAVLAKYRLEKLDK